MASLGAGAGRLQRNAILEARFGGPALLTHSAAREMETSWAGSISLHPP